MSNLKLDASGHCSCPRCIEREKANEKVKEAEALREARGRASATERAASYAKERRTGISPEAIVMGQLINIVVLYLGLAAAAAFLIVFCLVMGYV